MKDMNHFYKETVQRYYSIHERINARDRKMKGYRFVTLIILCYRTGLTNTFGI